MELGILWAEGKYEFFLVPRRDGRSFFWMAKKTNQKKPRPALRKRPNLTSINL